MFTNRTRAIATSLCLHGVLLALVLLYRLPATGTGSGDTPNEQAGGGSFMADLASLTPPEPEPQPLEPPQVPDVVDPQTPTTITPIVSTAPSLLTLASVAPPGLSAVHSTSRVPATSRHGGSGAGTGQGAGRGTGRSSYIAPQYVSSPAPEYPLDAKRLRREGVVILTVRVNEAGLPISVNLRHTSGLKCLDDAAIRTVQHWIFRPAQLGGQAIAALVEVPIRFRLTS